MKYYIYELYLKDTPYHAAFGGFVIYNRSEDRVVTIVFNDNRIEARKKCRQIIDFSTQYKDDAAIWRNWPITIDRSKISEEKIIEEIKVREI